MNKLGKKIISLVLVGLLLLSYANAEYEDPFVRKSPPNSSITIMQNP